MRIYYFRVYSRTQEYQTGIVRQRRVDGDSLVYRLGLGFLRQPFFCKNDKCRGRVIHDGR